MEAKHTPRGSVGGRWNDAPEWRWFCEQWKPPCASKGDDAFHGHSLGQMNATR